MTKVIKILIADDEPMVREGIALLLRDEKDMRIVGFAEDGEEAVRKTLELEPDVVLMDIVMPKLDGYEAVKRIMDRKPTPILMITSHAAANPLFKALSAGALDLIPKPEGGDFRKFKEELLRKIRLFAGISFPKKKEAEGKPISFPKSGEMREAGRRIRIIAVGSSTGGPAALGRLLKPLPPDFPASILVVQHIAPGFEKGLVEWLSSECRLKVKLAEDEEKPLPGTVYLAPPDIHLLIRDDGRLGLDSSPPVGGHRPSAELLFSSLARVCGADAVGIILSGMGTDGSRGLKILRDAGAHTFAQSEESCVVFGMPKAALEAGAVERVLPPEEISRELLRLVLGEEAERGG